MGSDYFPVFLGVLCFWVYLNLRNLIARKGRYVRLITLWQGRRCGKHPDGRPYDTVGIVILASIIF